MFTKQLFFSLLGFIFLSFVLFFHLRNIESLDIRHYYKLLASSDPDKIAPEFSFFATKQERWGVSKFVVFSDKNQRLATLLKNEYSTLVLKRFLDRDEIMERMDNVTGIMQEDLLVDGNKKQQKVRCFKASKASYAYYSDQFIAEKLHFTRYVVPEHHLTEDFSSGEQIMEGSASSLKGFLMKHTDNFQIRNFQMKLLVDGSS